MSRTMSKAFAFAGVRVGYLAADPAVVDALRLVRLPLPPVGAAPRPPRPRPWRTPPRCSRWSTTSRQQRDRLLRELPQLGYPVWPSWSNFVLFGGVDDPHAVFEALLAQDILIRDVGIPHHLQVTAGTEQETTAFLNALAKLDG